MKKRFLLVLPVLFLFLSVFAWAHGGVEGMGEDYQDNQDERYPVSQMAAFGYGSLFFIVLIVIVFLFHKKMNEPLKKIFFSLMAALVSIVTIYLIATTLHLNIISETKGPIHWHADFEIWNCGEKLNIADPRGMSNRVGSSVFHEHNDDRIHVEGVVVDYPDVDLHSFIRVIGGEMSNEYFQLPTNEGLIKVANGDLCNGEAGKVQVFLYSTVNAYDNQNDNFIYHQTKLENFKDYILSPYSNVPPGDCIIVEFGPEKDKTENICKTYEVNIQKDKMKEMSENGS